jgi:DNA-directed RNA polymerase sigma subunit (sigma70/sigma32)
MGRVSDSTRDFLAALDDLDRALDGNVELLHRMKERIAQLRASQAEGIALSEFVRREESPMVVQLLTESARTLHAYGARVRRTEAKCLHDEGMTMEEIARLFGVTRQRISALLREAGRAG